MFISIWKPYHSSINIHNNFLKLYYGTFVLFIIICFLFTKVQKLPSSLYIACMYIVMVLLSGILLGGFVRIYL